jgi:choline dehydrogenase
VTRHFYVIGAGAAGSAAARRLSDDPDVEVTVFEAGGRVDDDGVTTPAQWPLQMGGAHDYGYATVPQAGAGDRVMLMSRGKGLGGTTLINAMIHSEPTASDLDGWDHSSSPVLSRQAVEDVLSELRDLAPSAVADALPHHAACDAFVASAGARGFDQVAHMGRTAARGVGFFDLSIDAGGSRADAWSTHVAPVQSRPNLHVRSGESVRRLVIRDRQVVAIETVGADGETSELPIGDNGEVVLAAGAIDTPALLLRSGVGDSEALTAAGISPLVHLPGVGVGMQDHPLLPVVFEATMPLGPPQLQFFESALYLPDEPLAGGNTLSIAFGHIGFPVPGTDPVPNGVSALIGLYSPRSRGTVALDPEHPFGVPVIDPGYLTADQDVRALAAGVRIVRDIVCGPDFESFGLTEVAPGPAAATDTDLESFARAAVGSFYHPAGTARIGNDPLAVVDGTLRVHGLGNVRVVDLCVLPVIPAVATSVTAQMIGRRAAQLMLAAD